MEFRSYKGPDAAISESVYQFLRGMCWGSVWGLMTPIYAAHTIEAKREAATGIFRAAPPFKSFSSVPTNALAFGALLGVQRFSCRSMELVRGQEDFYNDLFGCGCMYPYFRLFMNTDRRLILHNRALGGAVALSVLYASVIA